MSETHFYSEIIETLFLRNNDENLQILKERERGEKMRMRAQFIVLSYSRRILPR